MLSISCLGYRGPHSPHILSPYTVDLSFWPLTHLLETQEAVLSVLTHNTIVLPFQKHPSQTEGKGIMSYEDSLADCSMCRRTNKTETWQK